MKNAKKLYEEITKDPDCDQENLRLLYINGKNSYSTYLKKFEKSVFLNYQLSKKQEQIPQKITDIIISPKTSEEIQKELKKICGS